MKKGETIRSRKRKATELPAPDLAAATALQALMDGTAEPEQQQRALRWIIEEAAGTYKLNFYDDERSTAFALGRAFVGQIIAGVSKMNLSTLRRVTDD